MIVAFADTQSTAVAVIIAVPAQFAVTRPFLSTVATFSLSLDHVKVLSVVLSVWFIQVVSLMVKTL